MCRLVSLFVLLCTVHLGAQTPQTATEKLAEAASAGVSLLPHRVVFEGRERSAEVLMKNSGATRASFRISVVEKDMTEDGRLQERGKKDGETTAADLFRFTPRQVDLEPGASQIVRIQLRKPEGLPDGEYRSHLLFLSIPPSKPAEQVEDGEADKKLSFRITQVTGISIPVIVRHGQTDLALSLEEPTYYQPSHPGAAPVISLFLARKGNRSVLGDMTVTLESGGTLPKDSLLWTSKAVGIYTNLSRRKVFLGLPDAANGKLKGSRVKVTFTPTDGKLAPVSTFVDLTF